MFGFFKRLRVDTKFWSVYLIIDDVESYVLHSDFLFKALTLATPTNNLRKGCEIMIKYNGETDLYFLREIAPLAYKRIGKSYNVKSLQSDDTLGHIHTMLTNKHEVFEVSNKADVFLENVKTGKISEMVNHNPNDPILSLQGDESATERLQQKDEWELVKQSMCE